MQRHFKEPAPQVARLSVEELAIQEDEALGAELALSDSVDDLDRVSEVSEVANDTMLIVDETPELGRVEQDLVAAVADMAVAGTDSDPEEVLAVTGEGEALTTEGIASALSSMWNAIVTAIKNMWAGLKHWLTTYFSSLEQNKKHAEELIKKLEGMKGFVPNGKPVHILDILGYGGAMTSISNAFNTVGKKLEGFMDYVPDTVDKQFRMMDALGTGMVSVYNSFDGKDASSIHNAVDGLVTQFGNYLKSIGVDQVKGEDLCSKDLANMVVKAHKYSAKIGESSNSPETKLAYISRVRLSVDQSTDFSTNHGINLKNDVTPDMVKVMVQERLLFINELIGIKADKFDKLIAQSTAVEKACSGMLTRVKEENKDGVTLAKKMMPLATAYANWAMQPAGKLLSVSARHNKFWLTLYEMTANNFVESK